MSALRVVFMGTPDFAVPTLAGVLAAGHEVVAVYTQPPRPAGRGKQDRKSPVHVFAEEKGLEVLTPETFKNAADRQVFIDHQADVAVVVAYGLLLPLDILEAPHQGCLNLHGSLLPRWRGAAPIQRAIMAGDNETAAAVMRMEEGLDTGPVCMEARIEISDNMTAGELHDEMAEKGAALMVRALETARQGRLTCRAQPEDGVAYAKKVLKSETRIDWSNPAHAVHNHIRGLSPWPGAWFEAELGGKVERIKVLKSVVADGAADAGTVLDDTLTIACGEGAVRLVEVQRAGKKPMSAEAFQLGAKLSKGVCLE